MSTHENTKWHLSVILSQHQKEKKEWSADGFKTVNRCLKYIYPRRCEMSINIIAEAPKVPEIWGLVSKSALESGEFWSIMRTWNLKKFGDIWGAECLRSLVDKESETLVLEGSYIRRESEGQKFWEFGGQGIWGRIWGILRALESGAREPKDWLGRDQGNGSPCHLPWASQAQVPY